MLLKDNKKIYLSLVKDFNEEITTREIIDTIEHVDKQRKEIYTALLILEAWPCVTRMYHRNNNAELTEEECYDIFLDSFFYLLDRKPWSKKSNKLYKDEDAFIKAMNTCCESRKKNYINSKFRDKRFVNYKTMSLDKMQEDYFADYLMEDKNKVNPYFILDDVIKSFINNYQFIEALVLDIIVSYNIFNDGSFSYIRLKKMIRDFDDLRFSDLYNIPKATSSMIKTGYLPSLSPSELDILIKQSLLLLQNDDRIKELLGKC